jgi:hypothetical protein
MNLRAFLLLFLGIGSMINAKESPFSAKIVLGTDTVTIPEPLNLEVVLTYPKGYHVELEQLRSNLLQATVPSFQAFFPISQTIKSSNIGSDNIITQKIEFKLEPRVPGEQTVSLFNVKFFSEDPKLKPVEIFTDFYKVAVELPTYDPSLVVKPVGPLPLSLQFPIQISEENVYNFQKNPGLLKLEAQRNVRIFNQRTFPWKSVLTLLALLSGLILFRNSIKQRIKKFIFEWFVKTPEEKAKEALVSLKKEKLPQKGQYDQYFVNLTNILRSYVDERFQINAPEETTEEFLHNKRTKEIFDAQQRENLSKLLKKADGIKFAQVSPRAEDCSDAYEIVEDLVTPQAKNAEKN